MVRLPQADEPVKVKRRERRLFPFSGSNGGVCRLCARAAAVLVAVRLAFSQRQVEKDQVPQAEGKQHGKNPEAAPARIMQASECRRRAGNYQGCPQEDGQGVPVNAQPCIWNVQPVRQDVACQGRNQGQEGKSHEPPEFRPGSAAPEIRITAEAFFQQERGEGEEDGCGAAETAGEAGVAGVAGVAGESGMDEKGVSV